MSAFYCSMMPYCSMVYCSMASFIIYQFTIYVVVQLKPRRGEEAVSCGDWIKSV